MKHFGVINEAHHGRHDRVNHTEICTNELRVCGSNKLKGGEKLSNCKNQQHGCEKLMYTTGVISESSQACFVYPRKIWPASIFFPSNARWLSPGRLSSRKDNCILQINRIKAAATSVVTTMCIQKGTELDQYTIHWLTPCGSKTATKQTKKTTQTKTRKTNNTNKPKKSTVGGQLISS